MGRTVGQDRVLRAVTPAELPTALAAALDGGPPVAPLPLDPADAVRARAALALDVPVSEPDAAVVVLTSGSTGDPKGVVLSRAAVRASAAATHARLGGPGAWVLALPAHYVAGLMVLARAHVAGAPVATVTGDLIGLGDALERLGDDRPRYLSVVPTQLARALADPALAASLARCDAVLVGGGPCPPTLVEDARSRGVAVVTTYGMSETCGGCVYDGRPLDGVEVRITDTGRVTIGGPTLFSGYRRRPDLTAGATLDGRLLTADRGRWDEDRLVVLGRTDDVVISGGLNVDLAEVERQARAWPALGSRGGPIELVVLGLPHPEWGTEVVAVVSPDRALTTAGLRDFLRPVLPTYAAPRRLVALEALPTTASGKIDRQRLRALLTHQREENA